MSQNRSHAVMAQRVEAADSLDDFPTPPWATRALLEHVILPRIDAYDLSAEPREILRRGRAWEPACNRGHMVSPLRDYFGSVHASDVHDYGWEGQERVCDFLFPGSEPPHIAAQPVDWIITNPPFRLAEQFIQRGLSLAYPGVAVIVRTAFLESVGRYEALFSKTPPTVIAQFAERVVMVKGRLTATGSTATAYCWLVWFQEGEGTEFTWIPPCRTALERDEDYEGTARSSSPEGDSALKRDIPATRMLSDDEAIARGFLVPEG